MPYINPNVKRAAMAAMCEEQRNIDVLEKTYLTEVQFNPLAPGRYGTNFTHVIFKFQAFFYHWCFRAFPAKQPLIPALK